VLHYSFEEGQGDVLDHGVSGNATPGKFYGVCNYNQGGKLGNWSMRSPSNGGSEDRLQVTGDVHDLDMNTSYSYMAWVKLMSGSGGKGIIVFGSCCSPREGYTLNLKSDGGLHYWAGGPNDDSNYNNDSNASVPNDGAWHHVGVRVKSGTVEFLIDGQVRGGGSAAAVPSWVRIVNSNQNPHGPHAPQLGGWGINGVTGRDMLIDEVRVYNTWLDDTLWSAAMAGN